MPDSIKLATEAQNWQKARATNTTDTSIPARKPVLSQPSGLGSNASQSYPSIIDFLYGCEGGVAVQNAVMVKPYMVGGADNDTMTFRIFGWNKAISGSATQWEPTLLAEVACTISANCTGVTGGITGATDYYADTLAVTYGNANVDVVVMSPADDATAGHAMISFKGGQLLEPLFKCPGTAKSANAFVKML